ncbi:class I SAM-dependent methyltransferase [uncultured Nitrospira sp.]|uniref:class I SAM-dependent methyltransferase n=1 Tax=uncultured Nitrospira sp. TaxID=157176 RepID=UPI0031400BCA
MAMTKPTEGPSPQLFFQTVNGHVRTAALKTAIELELFTALGEGHSTPQALAQRCGGSERGMRMLADYLTVGGFLTKSGEEYQLTLDSQIFLTRTSPAYLGPTLDFMLSFPLVEGFKQLTGAVRKGGTVVGEKGTLAPEHPDWVTFARSMVPLMKGPAEWIANWVKQEAANTRKVLDVAAGHGMFGVEIARKLPEAEITAQDWPNVLTVARENAQTAGITRRFHELPGSAFEVEFGKDYDVILLTNFLHHFDVPTCETFLKKVYGSLKPGGYVITLEFIPNEDRISPAPMAEFCLIMLATTPAGDAYVFSEYDRMFRHAGFGESIMHDVPASNERVIITKK